MDRNGNARHGVSRIECSYGFPFHNDYDSYCHGMEMKHQAILSETAQRLNIGPSMERDSPSSYGCSQEKKKRTLTNIQLESLERSFQEEIKLEPNRKMKLSRELGLEPRQIAVWFQNRRARWKARQMERSYEALIHDYDHISKEKQMLQEEVRKLKRFIRDNVAGSKQVAMMISGNTNCMISGEDMAESTSDAMNITRSNKSQGTNNHQCNPFFNAEEYNNPVSPPYWGFFP